MLAPAATAGDYGELDEWLRNVFVNAAYPYDDSPFLIQRRYYKLMGGVRLWQVRVNYTCSETDATGSCYSDWSVGNQADKPYGPGGMFPYEPHVIPPSLSLRVFAFGMYGWGQPSYGTSGYLAYLPNNQAGAVSNMTSLLDAGWIDEFTRVILLDFTLVNYDTNLQTTVRMQIETPASGHLLPSYEFFTYRRALYGTGVDWLRLVGEVILVLASFRYLFVAILRLLRYKARLDWRALFEVVVQVLAISCIGFWLHLIVSRNDYVYDKQIFSRCSQQSAAPEQHQQQAYFGHKEACWVDTYPYAQDYKYAATFAGWVGLLMAIKFFAYFTIYHSLSLVWITLARAGVSLLAFTFGFCLLVAGFAFMGQLCFGHIVPEFHNWGAAFSTLLRYPLGDFNYADLTNARPEVAGIFFALYMGLIFLVCLNMVVAIITIAFEEVTEESKVEEKWKHAGRGYFSELRQTGRLLWLLLMRWVYAPRWRSPHHHHHHSSSSKASRVVSSTASSTAAFSSGGSEESRMSTSASGDGNSSNSSSVSNDWTSQWWGAQELAVLSADAYYCELMAAFIETAEYNTRQDLMKYFEEVYQ